jgi:hypothetical protein
LHDPLLAVNAGVDHLGFGVSFKGLYDSGKIDEQTTDRVLFHTILPISRWASSIIRLPAFPVTGYRRPNT